MCAKCRLAGIARDSDQARLQSKCDQSASKLADVEFKNVVLVTRLALATHDCKFLETRNAALADSVDVLRREVFRLGSLVEGWKGVCEDKDSALLEAQSTNDELRTDLRKAHHERQSIHAKIATLRDDIKDLTSDLADLDRQVETSESHYQTEHSACQISDDLLSSTKQQLEASRGLLAAQSEVTAAETIAVQQKCNSAHDSLERVKGDLADARDELREQTEVLEERNEMFVALTREYVQSEAWRECWYEWAERQEMKKKIAEEGEGEAKREMKRWKDLAEGRDDYVKELEVEVRRLAEVLEQNGLSEEGEDEV